MIHSELISYLGEQGYQNVRTLADGTIVGTSELIFTRAIHIDLDSLGYGKRFCFSDRALALVELAKLESGDDEPAGYIARR